MISRSTSGRPEELTLFLVDRTVVDARDAPAHQPVVVELPVLVAVGAIPLATVVAKLVGEANGDPIVPVGPQLAAR